VSLKEAHRKRDEAKALLANGTDPGAEKKRLAVAARMCAESTFKAVADEFIEKIEAEGLAEATKVKTRWLAAHLEPGLGNRPVSEIEPFEVLTVLPSRRQLSWILPSNCPTRATRKGGVI